MPSLITDKSYLVSFKNKFLSSFHKDYSQKIAVLVSNEYEGFSRNGGIGTYYTNLSKKLAQAGWDVWLIFCQSQDKFAGKSSVSALKYVFSTSEVTEVLNLTNHHLQMLDEFKYDFYFGYQSLTSAFFAQAIASAFPDSQIYFEFPDVNGFAYHTLQAKNSNLLHNNCRIAITIHGCFEWVYEANDSINTDDWYNQSIYREQYTFENVDLAFFPSYFLKEKIESFGWETNHAQNMPYFVGIIPVKTYNLPKKIKPEILELIGMTSNEERCYVMEYAEKEYTGQGEIVDLGCWLGSLTVSLALGLQENQEINLKDKKIHAYDNFIWKDWMNKEVIDTDLAHKYKHNQSFTDAFLEVIKPYENLIQTYVDNLEQLDWQLQKPIEFLLVDAMKSIELANNIFPKFFSFLMPEVSLVHHQDYCHYRCPWIHLIMYRLKEYFEPIIYIRNGSMVFKNIAKIPVNLLQKKYSLTDFSPQEIKDAFEYSLAIVPDSAKANIVAAKIMLFVDLGDLETAKKELNLIKEKGLYSFNNELPIVENLIEIRRNT